jgi:hypothetical protein
MKIRSFLLAALMTSPLAFSAEGPVKEKALALAASHKDSVLFLSAVVEIEITAGENPAKKEERKLEMLGTVISKDGLIVVPLSTLDVASSIDGRTVNGPQGPMKIAAKGTTKEVKILMPDGSEVEAKVAFKDTDLDLAFIRPNKPETVHLTSVDTGNTAAMSLLESVIILGRLGKDLNREPVVMTSEIIAVITKPRTFGKIGMQSLGMPIFNLEGKFLGIGINRFSPKIDGEGQGVTPSNVILPAADLLESAAQVK